MLKSVILSLVALTGVSRTIHNVPINWTSYQYGYSICSDLTIDSSNKPFNITFDNSSVHKFQTASVSYSYGYDYQDLTNSVVARRYNAVTYNFGTKINLLSMCYGTADLSPLGYEFNDSTNLYNYYGSDFANPQQFVVYFDTDNEAVFIDSNYSSLYVEITYFYHNQGNSWYQSYSKYLQYDTEDTADTHVSYSSSVDTDSVDYYTIVVNVTNNVNQEQYNNGYTDGYDTGYTDGQGDGYNSGYNTGYNVGFINGSNAGQNFADLLFTIADTPLYYLKSMFNFELFGINVAVAILSLMSVGIAVYVVKKVI